MGGSLRILHTADSHIGAALPVRPRHDRPRRGDDFVDSFARVVHRAMQRRIDLAIHAGDLFNRSSPSSRALVAAAEPLLKLATADIPVVIVPGNHERSTIPSCLLLSHPNIHIVTEPCTLTFRSSGLRIAVSALPCLRRGSAGQFSSALDATGWSKTRADVRILAVHQTFESATCGPADHRFRSGDEVVERSDIPAAFDYVAAGHVHRHQVLSAADTDGPPIVYSGSPDRISFAEIDEPKGFVLVEHAGDRLVHSFIEHDVRPMSLWPVDVTSLTRDNIVEQFTAIVQALPPQSIAQVRLTGCSANGSLRGLSLAETARKLRPDVLLTVSARAVEFSPQSARPSRTGVAASAFAALNAPAEELHKASTDTTRNLPPHTGVYALYEGTGRLLYVGKSNNVRARVQAHLRGKTGANFFAGWARQITAVEARTTHSELEALLIEAELIRGLRPPFNRQMRRWSDYCYLCENGKPHGQLGITRHATASRACFGPFRTRHSAETVREAVAELFGLALCPDEESPSQALLPLDNAEGANLCERHFRGLCSGPCAERIGREEYHRLVHQRDALLSGMEDSALRKLETQLEGEVHPDAKHDARDLPVQRAKTLRTALNQTATLRAAEALVDALLLLPGPDGCAKTATLTLDGVHFDVLHNDLADARRILSRHGTLTRRRSRSGPARLPKTVADSLSIAARQLRQEPDPYRVISRQQTRDLERSSYSCGTWVARPSPRNAGAAMLIDRETRYTISVNVLDESALLAQAFVMGGGGDCAAATSLSSPLGKGRKRGGGRNKRTGSAPTT